MVAHEAATACGEPETVGKWRFSSRLFRICWRAVMKPALEDRLWTCMSTQHIYKWLGWQWPMEPPTVVEVFCTRARGHSRHLPQWNA